MDLHHLLTTTLQWTTRKWWPRPFNHFFLGTPSRRNTMTPFKERSPVPIHEICWGGYPVEFHMFISFVSCTLGATWVLKSRYLIDLILRTSNLTLGYSRHDVFTWRPPNDAYFCPSTTCAPRAGNIGRLGSKTAIFYLGGSLNEATP